MEDLVKAELERLIAKRDDICKCSRCKLDIIALTLNKFLSKYVVTQKGMAYTRLLDLQLQVKADIVKEITKAIATVKSKPQH